MLLEVPYLAYHKSLSQQNELGGHGAKSERHHHSGDEGPAAGEVAGVQRLRLFPLHLGLRPGRPQADPGEARAQH
ncbi:hypothetical protein HWI79_3605 [Cryptosporidium felis]|nr:hypothetical protein HWI79_3605 [Cryptosporidium felis]